MEVYITTKGDTWDSIAHKHYNNEELIAPIMAENRQHIETVVFDHSVELNIPDIRKAAADESILPPWRRTTA